MPSLFRETVVHGIELREIVYGERLLPRHAHAKGGFCLVLEGAYEERYAARTLTCTARTVTFSPAGAEHSNVFTGSRAHCLTVDVPQSWIERLESSRSRLGEPFQTEGGTLAWLAGRLLGELQENDGDGSQLIIEGIVLEMLGAAARNTKQDETPISPAIRQAHELLRASYRRPVSLGDLAAHTGRNPVYIATAFRQAYGETVGECLRRLRVEHAARALARSEQPIAEVALEAGFGSQSHLTRVFRRATGMTPAAWRAQLKKRQGT